MILVGVQEGVQEEVQEGSSGSGSGGRLIAESKAGATESKATDAKEGAGDGTCDILGDAPMTHI
jgi:hypothetical protein